MLDVKKVREDFPILKRVINGVPLVYLDNAATSQKPRQVINALVDFYENHNANIHRGVHTLAVEATEMVDRAREKIARFVGAKNEEIIFVRNATEGINLVAYAWARRNLQMGDEILVSLMEHHSNLVPWQEIGTEKNANLKVVEVTSEGILDLEDLKRELTEKTKLVAITAVSNVLGTIVPLKEVVKLIKDKAPAALILIDACQAVPHMKVEVSRMGVDFVVFSGHKMLGPTGIGVLWGRKEILSKMQPYLYGGDMISQVKIEKTTFADLPNRFEAGTPDIAGIIGLGVAVDYLNQIGMEQIREHEKELIKYALEKFEQLEKEKLVTLYGPRDPEQRAGVLTFNVNGVHAHDAAQILDKYGIAVRSGQHCGAPIVESLGVAAVVRASFYLYNTLEEIDFLAEKIKEVPKVFKI